MAEVLTTMVVGPLLSMVKEKASSYLLDQYKVMEGMEEQHKLLKRKLPAILDVIADAEEQAAKHREGAKAWLEELRKVAYKANDVLDEFKYEALRRKAKKEGHYKESGMDVIKLFPSHNRFVFRYRMANKLCKILQEIDILVAEMITFRFEFKPQPSISLKLRQTDAYISSYYVNIASESRAKEKQELVNTLLGQSSSVSLTVLPIVGMGGMGKTTLAQLVYNDSVIQKHFKVRLWVCVSENFDVDSLAERIVEAAPKENGSQANANSALEKLQNAISGKRYLLVLDDVWNREANKWEKLKSYLHHGGSGSSVLTTTRDKDVAQLMGTIKAYDIKELDEIFLKEIIKIGAFGLQAERPNALLEMVGDIAKRCSGSPLAATALGTILRTKKTMQEWEAVLRRNTICDEENGILPILKLSYNCLPPHMRQCFAFCAMFPKGYEIDVEMLIRLWMANCFIPEQQGMCPEFTGKQIFNELAQRSFFQEVKQLTIDNGYYYIFDWTISWSMPRYCSRITCKIHDLMHDVAQDSMGKECATIDTELKKLGQSDDFPYSARHLFLSIDIPETFLNASIKKGFPAIQTLVCDRSITQVAQHLPKCRSVRALKIQRGSFLEPKYLHHLRYLDLSKSDIEALPEDITILYHLQTLNLSDCRYLKQLPKEMRYMTALRHLYTQGCRSLKSMPAKLGHLTSLQTLTCFFAGTTSVCSNVGELEKLDLAGQLELKQLENVIGADAKAANLGIKKKLEELTLTWSDDRDKELHQEVLEGLKPYDGLKVMRIHSYGSNTIPTWMHKLQGMVELELCDCRNLKKLPALWKLPALKFLYLRKLKNLHCLFSGGIPSKFPKLKSMTLYMMPKFETWWDTNEVQEEEPIFPEVENLVLWHCGSLTALPKAAAIKESYVCRSAFPALKVMYLNGLERFHRWESIEATLGEHVTFPRLEQLEIRDCPGLTTFPEALKLSNLHLHVGVGSEQTSLQAISRYINSLSSLNLYVARNDTGTTLQAKQNVIELAHEKEEWNHESPLTVLELERCNLFFSQSSALALWTCFGQLVNLVISCCDALVYWPEKEFQGLVSLRTLEIHRCSKLVGHTEESETEQSGRLPCLESLEIHCCESFAEVPNLPASLKTFRIENCNNLKAMVFSQQEDMRLESLEISLCDGLSVVDTLPPSIKTLMIHGCQSLGSLSGELPSLEELHISSCLSLESLPNGPQAYSSLRVLSITYCLGIKLLPPSLQQRLDCLEKKYLDGHILESHQ